MSTDLARWQFATTSIYHFLFVPVTIGLAFLVALLQTSWYRHENPVYRRLTRFFGTLLLINVAIGVVTGLVQEFEFGMNWSSYSREVGNIFGGPLAMEGLLAFFLESTFLGLWIFGWDRLSKKAHLACIWLVAGATMISAAFIMAANSWMQHPVGYVMNAQHQPVLNNIGALFTNPVFLWSYEHQPGVLVELRPYRPGLARDRVAGHVGRVGRATTPQARGRGVSPYGDHLADRPDPVARPGPLRRQRARCHRGHLPTDEDCRRRGTVEHVQLALRVLAGAGRRRNKRRGTHPDRQHSRPAVDSGDQPRQRPGQGDEPAPGAVCQGVRRRQLRAERVRPVLVDEGHGLPGHARAPLRTVGSMAAAKAPDRELEVVPADRALGGRGPIPEEHGRLDADREWATAVDRPRADEDGRRCVT